MHLRTAALIMLFLPGLALGSEPEASDEYFVCADRLIRSFRVTEPTVSVKDVLRKMNKGLAGDLFGNRIGGMLYDLAQRLKRSRPDATSRELRDLVVSIYHGYAMASAGYSGTSISDLHENDRFEVYVEFGAATLDTESLIRYHRESWFESREAFNRSDFDSREYFPSDEEKLEQWCLRAEAWFSLQN